MVESISVSCSLTSVCIVNSDASVASAASSGVCYPSLFLFGSYFGGRKGCYRVYLASPPLYCSLIPRILSCPLNQLVLKVFCVLWGIHVPYHVNSLMHRHFLFCQIECVAAPLISSSGAPLGVHLLFVPAHSPLSSVPSSTLIF